MTLHEKGMTPRKVQSALLVPQISKSTTMTNPQMEPIKTWKHCTNYGWNNHNVETCIIKKEEESTIATTKVINQLQKGQKNNSYACHIYGLNGHKMMDCPMFVEIFKKNPREKCIKLRRENNS